MSNENKITIISLILAIFITAIVISCCILFGVVPTLMAILMLIVIFIFFIVLYGAIFTVTFKVYTAYKKYKNNKEE